jgi:transcriptional regulator with XRE-family HTH domain
MSERLMRKIQQLTREKGDLVGVAIMAEAVNKSSATVERWIKQGRIPSVRDARKIALVCGCEYEEAVQLATDCLPEKARDTA